MNLFYNELLVIMKTKYYLKLSIPFMIIFLLPGISSGKLFATPVDSIVSEANRHYMNREYAQAAILYQSVVDSGYEAPELYYNLGNAHYKLNQLAEAILFYEKAKKLAPYDEDIRKNLEMANMLIIDQVESIPEFFLNRWWRSVVNLFTPNVWAITSLVLFTLSLVCFFFYAIAVPQSRKRKFLLSSGLFVFLFSVSIYFLSLSRKNSIVNNQGAIVLDLSVTVKSSPDEQSTNVFVLHEGTRVSVLDSLENWREIIIANGNSGWVIKNSIGEI